MSKHTLYYSTRCRFCQAFLEELSSTAFVPEFQLVSVDPSPSRPTLPGWLKTVPSLVVAGSSTPLIGPGPVNNWLFERKLGGGGSIKSAADALSERSAPLAPPEYNPDMAPRPNATARTPAPARGGPGPAISGGGPANTMSMPSGGGGAGGAGGASSEGLLDYNGAEMGSTKWSDNYSFLGQGEGKSETMYNPISRNFESLIGNMPTPSAGAGGGGAARGAPKEKVSEKEKKLLSEFEAYASSRDRDIPGAIARK